MRKPWMILMALVAMLSLALVACGGDDDDDDDNGDGSPRPTATQSSGGNGNGNGNGGGNGGSGDAETDFRARANALEGKTFSATFQIRYEDSIDGIQDGTMRFAVDPEGGRFALFIDASGDGGLVRGAFIETPDASYICFDEPPDDPGCIDLALLGGSGGLFAGLFSGFNVQGLIADAAENAGRVERIADRTINGRSAECYQFEDVDGDGVACFDKQTGVVLFVQGEDSDGNFRLETASYSESVSDSDFEPPFPLVDPDDF